MLTEINVDLDTRETKGYQFENTELFGKALAVDRILNIENPEDVVYLTGYAPLTAAGLGFSGKMNIYGISLLGNNLQGSRTGGLITSHLTLLGIPGIQIIGRSRQQLILYIDSKAKPSLIPLSQYGEQISGTCKLAQALYHRHGTEIALALTDPFSTGFRYKAIVCNSKKGGIPDRVAGRGTTLFGRNGLVGIVVEKPFQPLHSLDYDRKAVLEILRRIHKTKHNITLTGSANADRPLLGGTYGSAAEYRFDFGHGLTNLFRDANVPGELLADLLPDNIIKEQIEFSSKSGKKIKSHSCVPGCPNRCGQYIILKGGDKEYRVGRAGEWETYQGLVNLGIFENIAEETSKIIEHSNIHAYDHIEGLVTLAALALVSETKRDTGVRYGDLESVFKALDEAVEGRSDLGRLVGNGADAVEKHYGIERHFSIGGHALPFHNGRSMLQTGVGLSWTYGRHGEACAGPGRKNLSDDPYDPTDHNLDPKTHVLNAIHGMILYGAMDELGLCFFMGPSIDSLVDNSLILNAIGIESNPREMVLASAGRIRNIHAFNKNRGVTIQSLPRVFLETPTHGNKQTEDDGVIFNVPFDIVHEYGTQVLDEVADGKVTIPDKILEKSQSRYD